MCFGAISLSFVARWARFLYASLLARRGPVPESQRESRKFLMVAPGQDQPGRHPNEALLLEALDEFDSVESTPLKLCKPSLQNNQGGICSAIGDGSRGRGVMARVCTLSSGRCVTGHLARTGGCRSVSRVGYCPCPCCFCPFGLVTVSCGSFVWVPLSRFSHLL